MAETEIKVNQYRTSVETRLTRMETQYEGVASDIKEIKVTLRWMLGVIFGLNTTIIGILTKGFGIFLGIQ